MSHNAYTYIMASGRNGTLYVGVTSDLERRIAEHRLKIVPGFTGKYDVDKLVWFEAGTDIRAAIETEKKIKNRSRAFKLGLIERENPQWRDLADDFIDAALPDTADPPNDGLKPPLVDN